LAIAKPGSVLAPDGRLKTRSYVPDQDSHDSPATEFIRWLTAPPNDTASDDRLVADAAAVWPEAPGATTARSWLNEKQRDQQQEEQDLEQGERIGAATSTAGAVCARDRAARSPS
jgi:hypothetical protein